MNFHRFIDKEEVIREFNPEKEEWKWAIHIKPTKVKKYGRFWRPETKINPQPKEKYFFSVISIK